MPARRLSRQRAAFPRRQRGFSLIEILVAFMILAMALTVIFRIFSGGLRNVALAEDYALAELVAESQMSVVGISQPLQPGQTSGEWGDGFRWERVIERYDPWGQDKKITAPLAAYQVTINVYWQHVAGESRITLSSIRLKNTDPLQGRG